MTRPPNRLLARRDVDRRVPESQAQARQGLLLSLLFVAAAVLHVVAAGDRWISVHLFAAGGLASAFSGVSVMLAVTWSTAPAPAPALGIAQRAAVAVGALGVVVTRSRDLPSGIVGAFGLIYALGLLGLAVLLVDIARQGSKRRFDPAVTGWAAALVLAVLGTTAGIALASGSSEASLRSVHLTTNLLGFLGVAIATTVPFFGSTVVRAKMNRAATPAAIHLGIGLLGCGALLAVIGIAAETPGLAATGFAGHTAGVLAIYRVSPRPTRRQLEWAGPRLLGLWFGGLWWAIAVGATAVRAADGRLPLTGRWLLVLLIGAYAQILWASLAYLLPMLRGGGHELLSTGFATTRSWVTLVAIQVAVVAAIAEAGTLLRVMAAVVLLDTTRRVVLTGAGRRRDPVAT